MTAKKTATHDRLSVKITQAKGISITYTLSRSADRFTCHGLTPAAARTFLSGFRLVVEGRSYEEGMDRLVALASRANDMTELLKGLMELVAA